MMRAILLAVCLLTGSVQAEGLFGERAEPGRMPSRFIRFDAGDFGLLPTNDYPAMSLRLGKVTCVMGPVRFGLMGCDSYQLADEWGEITLLPVLVGFTLWSNPKRTTFFYGAVPDVYVEASAGFWNPPGQFAGRLAVCCDVDYYGLGVGLEAGAFSLPAHGYYRYTRGNLVYAGLQFRFLTFGIGF